LKRLIDQSGKEIFSPFILIGQSNASKHPQRLFDCSQWPHSADSIVGQHY